MIIAVLSLLCAIFTGFDYSHVSGFLPGGMGNFTSGSVCSWDFFSPFPVSIGWTHIKISLRQG